jgi:hypothetical protein
MELSKDRTSRQKVGYANFVTMDLLATERTNDTKRGYFRGHIMDHRQRDIVPKILKQWMYVLNNTIPIHNLL